VAVFGLEGILALLIYISFYRNVLQTGELMYLQYSRQVPNMIYALLMIGPSVLSPEPSWYMLRAVVESRPYRDGSG